jgi:hypothetical protein
MPRKKASSLPTDPRIARGAKTTKPGLTWPAEGERPDDTSERIAEVNTSGTSIFDPVLCELCYRWFCPPDGLVLDPFAGGSVRGIVAAKLGRSYLGVDLSAAQVAANHEQWERIGGRLAIARAPEPTTDDPEALTPVTTFVHGWLKRDDLFEFAGVRGGKVRTCLALARAAQTTRGHKGLVTAGSRSSPQVNIVAHVGAALGMSVRAHTPQGELSAEVLAARDAGAEIIQHKAGYNNVIIARAREDAADQMWTEIPFGMECQEAIAQTRKQVANLPEGDGPPSGIARIVIACGSGMSLAGVLHGLDDCKRDIPVLAVVVGADPAERLDKYAPADWRRRVSLVPSGTDYHESASQIMLDDDVMLDPHYEAKCIPFLQEYDLLWVVGIRATMTAPPPMEAGIPEWIVGDSRSELPACEADFLFSCPPYADLEVYSDDPRDLSTMPYERFIEAYRGIIAEGCARLKPNRFAAFVVGDLRDKDGYYRGFPWHTIQAFQDAGLHLWNEAVLVTAVGSLPIRARRPFVGSRKLGKTHQNLLVFVKGDPKKAALACGTVEVAWPEAEPDEDALTEALNG